MIGWDTNVLARYFAQDHPLQSAQATACVCWATETSAHRPPPTRQ